MKIYSGVPSHATFICETVVCFTGADLTVCRYDFENTTYIQPCSSVDFCISLGLPIGAKNRAEILIKFSTGRPALLINTFADGYPYRVYQAIPTDEELFQLIGHGFWLLACDVQDTHERINLYENVGTRTAALQ